MQYLLITFANGGKYYSILTSNHRTKLPKYQLLVANFWINPTTHLSYIIFFFNEHLSVFVIEILSEETFYTSNEFLEAIDAYTVVQDQNCNDILLETLSVALRSDSVAKYPVYR
uniref:Coatomer subunit zeta n=1 Tax=Syphacia muris TaxID=451379 RepID=A0A0N5AFF0_9BILA